jgi:cytochrome c peroxidase
MRHSTPFPPTRTRHPVSAALAAAASRLLAEVIVVSSSRPRHFMRTRSIPSTIATVMIPTSISSGETAAVASRRLGALACVVFLLLVISAAAETRSAQSANGPPRIDEPITPIPAPPPLDPRRLALGEQLFQDRRLSGSNALACASCHDVQSNGSDGKNHAMGPSGSELQINTPTVFNAALSFRFNWEGNHRSLEGEAEASLVNPRIMATSMGEVVAKLRGDPELVRRFREAYGREPDRENLLDAIATYERSLLTPGSRFDRWIEGDAAALSAKEQEGYRLFKSIGCVSCHQGVNVGGNLYERHGIFHPLAAPKPEILRVPSLRNVSVTPPYFHDGSAPTLAEAVRRMGEAQLDRSLPDEQVDAIVAFLSTLTGTYHGAPVAGPRAPP